MFAVDAEIDIVLHRAPKPTKTWVTSKPCHWGLQHGNRVSMVITKLFVELQRLDPSEVRQLPRRPCNLKNKP